MVKCQIQCLYKFFVPPEHPTRYSQSTLLLSALLALLLLLLLIVLLLIPSDHLSSSCVYGTPIVSPISFNFFSLLFTHVSLLFLLLQKLGCLILTMMERSSPLATTFFANHRGSCGGGVLLAIDNNLPVSLLSSPSSLEVLAVSINMAKPIIVAVVHIPPSTDSISFTSLLPTWVLFSLLVSLFLWWVILIVLTYNGLLSPVHHHCRLHYVTLCLLTISTKLLSLLPTLWTMYLILFLPIQPTFLPM